MRRLSEYEIRGYQTIDVFSGYGGKHLASALRAAYEEIDRLNNLLKVNCPSVRIPREERCPPSITTMNNSDSILTIPDSDLIDEMGVK